MPKGGRSMTAEEKNKILELRKQGLSYRKIKAVINRSLDTLHTIVNQSEGVAYYTDCPVCGKNIPHYKKNLHRGKQQIYCSEVCRQSKEARKTQPRVCLNCGKTFLAWKYEKTKFCCHECYVEHRNGKRLQNKSS